MRLKQRGNNARFRNNTQHISVRHTCGSPIKSSVFLLWHRSKVTSQTLPPSPTAPQNSFKVPRVLGFDLGNPEEEESHVSACKLRILRAVKAGQTQCWHVALSLCRCYAELRIPAAKCAHLSAAVTCRTKATESNSSFHHFRSSFAEHVGARLTFASTPTNETPLSVGETLRSPW